MGRIHLHEFRQQWNEERRQAPYAVYVSNREQFDHDDPRPGCGRIAAPIRVGDPLILRFIPTQKGPPRYPLTLIKETLTAGDEMRLTTALLGNKHHFNLDPVDSLAIIAYTLLFVWDWHRAQQGNDSLLLEPPAGIRLEPISEVVRNYAALNFAWVRLSDVLDFWNHIGLQLAHHYLTPVPDAEQRATYTHVPARQLDPDEVSAIYGHDAAVGTDETATDECVFRKVGKNWFVRYQGQEATLKNLKGLEYLAILLESRYKILSSTDLSSAVNKSLVSSAAIQDTARFEEDLQFETEQWEEPNLRYDAEIRDRLQQLEEDRVSATERDDTDRIVEIDKEEEDIKEYAPSQLRRRHRTWNSQQEKDRKAVSNALTFARKRISDEIPRLEHHLEDHLQTGVEWCYAPPEDHPAWLA